MNWNQIIFSLIWISFNNFCNSRYQQNFLFHFKRICKTFFLRAQFHWIYPKLFFHMSFEAPGETKHFSDEKFFFWRKTRFFNKFHFSFLSFSFNWTKLLFKFSWNLRVLGNKMIYNFRINPLFIPLFKFPGNEKFLEMLNSIEFYYVSIFIRDRIKKTLNYCLNFSQKSWIKAWQSSI